MSETPTTPFRVNEQVIGNPDRWISPEIEAAYRSGELIDINSEEALYDDMWNAYESEDGAQVERIEEAKPVKPRSEEIEESLFYLDNKQLATYALQISNAQIGMRAAYDLAA